MSQQEENGQNRETFVPFYLRTDLKHNRTTTKKTGTQQRRRKDVNDVIKDYQKGGSPTEQQLSPSMESSEQKLSFQKDHQHIQPTQQRQTEYFSDNPVPYLKNLNINEKSQNGSINLAPLNMQRPPSPKHEYLPPVNKILNQNVQMNNVKTNYISTEGFVSPRLHFLNPTTPQLYGKKPLSQTQSESNSPMFNQQNFQQYQDPEYSPKIRQDLHTTDQVSPKIRSPYQARVGTSQKHPYSPKSFNNKIVDILNPTNDETTIVDISSIQPTETVIVNPHIVVGIDGEIFSINDPFGNLLGVKKDAVVNKNIKELCFEGKHFCDEQLFKKVSNEPFAILNQKFINVLTGKVVDCRFKIKLLNQTTTMKMHYFCTVLFSK